MELVQEAMEVVSQELSTLSMIAELHDFQLTLVGGGNLDVICG
jgi:hypothetical protein